MQLPVLTLHRYINAYLLYFSISMRHSPTIRRTSILKQAVGAQKVNKTSPKLLDNSELANSNIHSSGNLRSQVFLNSHAQDVCLKDSREQLSVTSFSISSVFYALVSCGCTNMDGIIRQMFIPGLTISIDFLAFTCY